MKNVLTPLAKSISIPLGLTTAVSATEALLKKKINKSGVTTLILLKEEMGDITEIVNFLKESGLMIRDVSKGSKRTKIWGADVANL